ncbi:hypothetical protein EST38_g6668 [Candolleomyces aberdarensis]|uniref:Uncharacterized protein n=1 Tax=Candolleomyces aberdarensis TaxID=2316362 RepID=A0A4Q2DHK9_9AGAR|nr:hypothetical protein EST38_g6668 [Candolleomyces aberdarensis]
MASPDDNVLEMNHYSNRVNIRERQVQHSEELLNITRNAIAQTEAGADYSQLSPPPYSLIDPLTVSDTEIVAAMAALQADDAAPVIPGPPPGLVPRTADTEGQVPECDVSATGSMSDNGSSLALDSQVRALNSAENVAPATQSLLPSNQGPPVPKVEDIPVTPHGPVTIQRRRRPNAKRIRNRPFLLPSMGNSDDTDTSTSSQSTSFSSTDTLVNIAPGLNHQEKPRLANLNPPSPLTLASPGSASSEAHAISTRDAFNTSQAMQSQTNLPTPAGATTYPPPAPPLNSSPIMGHPLVAPYAAPGPYHPPLAPYSLVAMGQPPAPAVEPPAAHAMVQPPVAPYSSPPMIQSPVVHYPPPSSYGPVPFMPIVGSQMMQPYPGHPQPPYPGHPQPPYPGHPQPPNVHVLQQHLQWLNWQTHLLATGQMQQMQQK